MRLSQSKQIIDAYVVGIRAVGTGVVTDGLCSLAKFLAAYADEQMSTLAERAATIDIRAAARSCLDVRLATITQVATQLDVVANVVESGGGKLDSIRDLRSLGKILRQCSESEDTLQLVLDKLRAAMEPQPVEMQIGSFIERLNRETGTVSFERTLAELAASPLRREHVVSIAKSVYGGIKNATSRKGALAYIRKPHDARLGARRGIEATGGRSAA
jgi:hypothetical protein